MTVDDIYTINGEEIEIQESASKIKNLKHKKSPKFYFIEFGLHVFIVDALGEVRHFPNGTTHLLQTT